MLLAVGSSGYKASAQQVPVDGTSYYLYNVETGKFLTRGNTWGTQAVTNDVGSPWQVKIADGKYTLRMYDIVAAGSNNGLGPNGSGIGYSDNGSPAAFTPNGDYNGYKLVNGSNYLTSPATYGDNVLASDANGNTTWQFLNVNEYKAVLDAKTTAQEAAIATAASITLGDKTLAEVVNDKNAWRLSDVSSTVPFPSKSTWTHTGVSNRGGNDNDGTYGVETYQGGRTYTYTATGLTKGVYKVGVKAMFRSASNAACSTVGDAGYVNSSAYFSANGNIVQIKDWYSSRESESAPNNTDGFVTIANNGGYLSEVYAYVGDDGTLELKAVSESYWGNSWFLFNGVTLTYYTDQVTDEDADALLASVPTEKMNADVQTALNEAKNAFEADKSIKSYNDLSAAIESANTSIANYATVKSAIDAAATNVTTLDADGQAAYDITSVQTAYDSGTITDGNYSDYINNVKDALTAAVKAQTTVNSDWTLAISNPSFEDGFTGWTNNGMAIQSNTSFAKTGINYAETWQPNGTKSVSQTLTSMPAGIYTLTAHAKARSVTSAKISAAGIEQAITVADSDNDYSVTFACDANADIAISFEAVGTGANASWICVDNFTLKLVSSGLPDVTAVDGKMNSTVAQAQTNAVAAYNANRTVANYNAAQSAITSAQTSKDAYTAAKTAIDKANAVKTNHNFASSAATATFAEAIAAISNAYEDGSLSDADANAAGTTLGVSVSGHRANPNGAAVKYLNDGFSLNDFDAALYVNTWSTEGDNDGSEFSVPFYEYWTGDANSLAENTWTGTMTGLNNGLYSVQALVRVRAKNETAVADATGITMDVNGATAVDVTEGTQVGESQFQLATYTAEGLVKDGNLNLHFNIAEENNISWLSFKNIKYTKVRDLTAEEEATAPTAIALYNGETEVTSPIALDKTTTTVTLTPSYTPVNATEGYITWLSSDPSVVTVVDGVVTAITSGTATITVTSTLDTNVTASATITVAFPESTVPAYENEGATRKIHNYGDNLIKNGSFDYTDGFYGWLNGAGSKLGTNSGFTLVEEDGENVLRAVNGSNSDNGGGSVKSIKTGWPIESDKTYVFGYRVKSSGTAEYHVVSMTNTIGTETAPLNTQNERKAIKYNGSWTEQSYEFTNSGGYKYVQFAARWLSNSDYFDDFYLVEKTAADGIEGNVDYATDAIPTANIGTGAFQYSQNAIDAANALVQGTATVEDVENAYAAVTTVNEPANGQLFNVILTYGGYQYDNKAMTYIANGRNNQGLYAIQYEEVANKNLAQAFTFTKVDGNKYKMSQIDTDGNPRYFCTARVYDSSSDGKGIRTTTNSNEALEVLVIPTATEGVYNLKNTVANNYLGSQDQGVYTVNSHIDFKIVETTKPSITINTTAAGWGTTILPFAVASLPAGVKAYSCSEVDGNSLILVEVDALEANKPYLIEGVWNETLTGDAQGTKLTYTDGLFTGVYASQAAPVGTYVLQKIKDKVAFYVVGDGNQPTVGANRVYMTEPSNVKSVYYFDGEDNIATGINAIDALINGDAEIFNAAGVKMPTLQKGLNIIRTNDGKTQKVFVK